MYFDGSEPVRLDCLANDQASGLIEEIYLLNASDDNRLHAFDKYEEKNDFVVTPNHFKISTLNLFIVCPYHIKTAYIQ